MMVMMMMMIMMMMMMCKRFAQVPMLCVPIYNIKLAMMQKLPFLARFQHIRRLPPKSAGKTRCLAVTILVAIVLTCVESSSEW